MSAEERIQTMWSLVEDSLALKSDHGPAPRFQDRLEKFVHCEVSFAVIGDYAVGHHAKPRAIKDPISWFPPRAITWSAYSPTSKGTDLATRNGEVLRLGLDLEACVDHLGCCLVSAVRSGQNTSR